MTHEEPVGQSGREVNNKSRIARRLDTIGWGLFFIWVGIVILADLGWGIGLVGVGVLVLAEQMVRIRCGLRPEGFWVVVGILLVVGGGWELMETHLWLVAAVLIIAGVALLLSAAREKV